jgi:hypothetical protein
VFSEAGFAAIYDQGIFKYRVLGISLLRAVHSMIGTIGLPV